ncbi:MAG: putative DNA binding domain-containing protein [Verrucomicrobiales bacterium]
METPNTIMSMIAAGESKRLEFKSGNAGIETLGATICAFLNSGGGQILIGVRAEGNVEGGADAKRIEEMLHPLSGGDDIQSMLTPNAIWDVTDEPTNDGTVVLIDVPAGADLPYVFQDAIYVRVGSRTQKATGSQTRELIERRYLQGARWERQPILEVGLKDLDEEEIRKTVQVATNRRGWRFRDADDMIMVLEDLNLIEHGRLTHAAVVLFAKEAGHILPQSHVRLTAYASDKAAAEFNEDKVSRGHLFEHLRIYDAFLNRQVAVMSEFSATKQHREDRPQYPYWSLREGFRNALIHRDYESIHGRVSASVYPGRFEVWSYGGLPPGVSISSLKTGDRSLPVNPDIAQVVFLQGLVELLGRGTRKMVEEFRSQGLPEPSWKKQAGGICLTLHSRAGAGVLPKEINSRQIALLRRMRPGGETTLPDYTKESEGDLSERALRDDLAKLVRLGFLAKQGKGKNTFYVRTEKPA